MRRRKTQRRAPPSGSSPGPPCCPIHFLLVSPLQRPPARLYQREAWQCRGPSHRPRLPVCVHVRTNVKKSPVCAYVQKGETDSGHPCTCVRRDMYVAILQASDYTLTKCRWLKRYFGSLHYRLVKYKAVNLSRFLTQLDIGRIIQIRLLLLRSNSFRELQM